MTDTATDAKGSRTASSLPPARPDAVPTRARTALSVALLAVLYLWVFPYHAQVNNPNENVRIYMTVAMVDDGTFAINRVERDWGYVNDKAVRDTPLEEALGVRRVDPEVLAAAGIPADVLERFRAGRATREDRAMTAHLLYSSKAPGTSYLGVPAYWLLTRVTGRNSRPLTPAQIVAHHRPPLERTTIVYFLRLWSNVLPALLFAAFWHRFLGRYTSSPALREAAFFSTMAGSLLFAYSEVFASHAHNAFCTMAALMALATVRRHDREASLTGAAREVHPWLMAAAGCFGAGITLFEYPPALATFTVALLILATGSARFPLGALGFLPCLLLGARLLAGRMVVPGLAIALLGVGLYAATLDARALARLLCAGLGSAPPTFLSLWFHKRAFGGWFKTGYSFLENPVFRSETSQGFFGATHFSWESGVRLWFDPAFGLVPMTALFAASLFGLAAFLAVRPPRWLRNSLLVVLGLFIALCAVRLLPGIRAVRDLGWLNPASSGVSWGAWIVLATLAALALVMPRPRHPDAALGAAMLLVTLSLSFIIGMMNNWRGGWQVGPRYLATLAPLLGFCALVGLDALGRSSPLAQRAVTVFAAAATLHAMVMSGLPSTYFPHVPTEFMSPTVELFLPLVRDGYAPHNAGQYLFHLEGNRSMAPFFLAAAVAALLVLKGDEERPALALSHGAVALGLCAWLLVPFAVIAHRETAGNAGWVRSIWEPALSRGPSGAPDPREPRTAAEWRQRGRTLSEAGNGEGALEAFRRAADLER